MSLSPFCSKNQWNPAGVALCRASSCEPKGHWFNSGWGQMPVLWARSQVGGVQETTDQCILRTSMFFLSSLQPFSKENKNNQCPQED